MHKKIKKVKASHEHKKTPKAAKSKEQEFVVEKYDTEDDFASEEEMEREEIMAEINAEKEARLKTMILWSGVTFFMVLIGVVWIFNTKRALQAVEVKGSGQEIDWSKMTDDFSNTMKEMKKGLDEIRAVATSTPESVGNEISTTTPVIDSATSALSTSTLPLNDNILDDKGVGELKAQLEKIK